MTNNNQEIVCPQDRELFHNIAKEIRNNPDKYLETGKWLDKYCSEDAYWQRQEDKLHKIGRDSSFKTYSEAWKAHRLEQEIRERRIPALLIRFQEARDYLLEKYKDEQFILEEDAKRIILITWLLTEPDAEKSNLDITKLEKWLWEPTDDITKMSRGSAQSLWVQIRAGYELWMKLVRVAWSKIAEVMVETSYLPTKVEKPTFARNILRNFLRASIKHFPFGGAFLYDVIYGTLDDQASKKQMTPQPEAPQAGVTFQKDQEGSFVKGDVEKWYKTNTFKYVVVPLAAALIVAIPAWIALFHKDSTESGDGGTISAQNKLPTSLREICQDIDSRPLVQREVTAKQYIGISIENERLTLYDARILGTEQNFHLTMMLPEEAAGQYVIGRVIIFNIEKEKYSKLVTAKRGLEIYISGRIEYIGPTYIKLSEVSLRFE